MKASLTAVLVTSLTFGANLLPANAQVPRQMLFMGESRGVRVYIDPQKIVRRLPFVRFWVYAVLPRPNSRRVSSLDTLMAIDCTVGSVRIHEILRYDSAGEVVSTSSFGWERDPFDLRILGEFDRAIFRTVCNQPHSFPL
jgi:hypothetical protein